jgi:hypothetical protein
VLAHPRPSLPANKKLGIAGMGDMINENHSACAEAMPLFGSVLAMRGADVVTSVLHGSLSMVCHE